MICRCSKSFLLAASLIATFVICTGAAEAATIQHSTTINPVLNGNVRSRVAGPIFDEDDRSVRVGSFLDTIASNNFTISKFDDSLGTLEAVTFDVSFSIDIESTLDCVASAFCPSEIVGPMMTNVYFDIFNFESPYIAISQLHVYDQPVLTSTPCAATCLLIESFAWTTQTALTEGFERFSGSGDIQLGWNVWEQSTRSGIVSWDNSPAEFTLTTTYSYVPEPGTALLLGSGLFVLSVRSRRSERRND